MRFVCAGEAGHSFEDAKRELKMHGLKAYLFRGNHATVPVQ